MNLNQKAEQFIEERSILKTYGTDVSELVKKAYIAGGENIDNVLNTFLEKIYPFINGLDSEEIAEIYMNSKNNY